MYFLLIIIKHIIVYFMNWVSFICIQLMKWAKVVVNLVQSVNCANCQHILQIEQKILHFMNWQLSRMGRNIDGLDNLTILYSRINRQKLFTSICSRRLLQLQYVSVVFWKNIRLKTLKNKTKHQTTFQWFIFRIKNID